MHMNKEIEFPKKLWPVALSVVEYNKIILVLSTELIHLNWSQSAIKSFSKLSFLHA